MSSHLENFCRRRLVTCTYCKTSIIWCSKRHTKKCLQKPISCTRCQRMIQRAKMYEHISTDCPKKVIKCSYAEISGCIFQCERGRMDKHLESAVVDHTTIALEKFKKLNEEVSKLKDALFSMETYVSWNEEPGTFLWALKDKTERQHSATHYTSHPGYNIRFECRGISDQFEIRLRSIKGDHDDDVDWPADFDCTATLFEQGTTRKGVTTTKQLTLDKMGVSDKVLSFQPQSQYVKNGNLLLRIQITQRNLDDSDDPGTSDDQTSDHSTDSDDEIPRQPDYSADSFE
eukprot:m.230462 g.230462  ORF g.230462 m.230462 type:complete len:287 (+) comp40059_c0_seq39:725-1585(+)